MPEQQPDPLVYPIERVEDFLRVPVGRLGACLKELYRVLLLHHATNFAALGKPGPPPLSSRFSYTWIDDGEENDTFTFPRVEGRLRVTIDRSHPPTPTQPEQP